MTSPHLPATVGADLGVFVQLVEDAVTSIHSKRAYRRAIADFLAWWTEHGRGELSKADVRRYAAELAAEGKSPANINQRLCAIRKLVREAADNGALPEATAAGICRVEGLRQEGQRRGNWLSKAQAERLLDAPDTSTLKGARDRALFALLLGCGLRRAELAALTFDHLQQRDARWVVLDLVGKRQRVRTVPMPAWCKALVDQWARAAGIASGHVLRPLDKAGRVAGERLSTSAIYKVVGEYARALGWEDIAPHDLRRTFAQLAHKGRAPVDQIQLSLGHSSIVTTERYLGVEQSLLDAPCDRLGLRVTL